MNNVWLVMFSDYDLATLSQLSRQMFGQGICANADAKDLPEKPHNVECLKNFGHNQNINNLYYVSFLILIDSRDIVELLEILNGLAFIRSITLNRDYEALIVTGSLSDWEQVLVNGCKVIRRREIDSILRNIKKELDKIGFCVKVSPPVCSINTPLIEHVQ